MIPNRQDSDPASVADLLSPSARADVERFARSLAPYGARLQATFEDRLRQRYDAQQRKALLCVTPAAAGLLLASGRALGDYFEQVDYSGRRLARCNVPPAEVLQALGGFDHALDPLLQNGFPRHPDGWCHARQQLSLCVALALNRALYRLREDETQAFYGLYQAEREASGLDDLLRRFVAVLARAFHATAGRLELAGAEWSKPLVKKLSKPRYTERGGREEEFLIRPALRGRHACYWSVPFFAGSRLAGVIQFGFAKPYRWLPRELQILDAAAERCLAALDRARLAQDLSARENELRRLAGRMLRAEEEERRRIGRELHDEVGQALLSLRLELDMLEKRAPDALVDRIAASREIADATVSEIRRIIAALNPSALDQLGLHAALRHLLRRFQQSNDAKVRLRISPGPARAPREVETAVYRIVQESLNNISRHAAATRVNLSLYSTDKQLELVVGDNGIGFDVDEALAQPHSFGIAGMRERVTLLGGHFEITSSAGRGTRISVELPLE